MGPSSGTAECPASTCIVKADLWERRERTAAVRRGTTRCHGSVRDVWRKEVQTPLSSVRAALQRGCPRERHMSRGICRLVPSKQQTLVVTRYSAAWAAPFSHVAIAKIAKEFPSFMLIICLQAETLSALFSSEG